MKKIGPNEKGSLSCLAKSPFISFPKDARSLGQGLWKSQGPIFAWKVRYISELSLANTGPSFPAKHDRKCSGSLFCVFSRKQVAPVHGAHKWGAASGSAEVEPSPNPKSMWA